MTPHAILAVVAACALMLSAPALLNGGPFLYFDSGAYLGQMGRAVTMATAKLGLPPAMAVEITGGGARPDGDGTVVAGRSIYYGAFAWLALRTTGIAAALAVQAAVLAALVVATVRVARPDAGPGAQAGACVAISAVLGLGTSAGFFAGLVMPDLWAGLMILALALLVSGAVASAWGRAGLGAVMALSALFHTSHLALLAAATTLLLPLALLRPGLLPPRTLRWPAAAAACGVAGVLAFGAVVEWVTGAPPMARPHVTAHLVEMGPGTRLARTRCPEAGFVLCDHVDRLPVEWKAFLFSRDPALGLAQTVPIEVQRALADEQVRFAAATLAAEPLATLGGLAGDGISQLWHLSVDDVPLTRDDEAFVAASFPPQVAAAARASAIWDRPWVAPALTLGIQIGTAASAAGLLAMALAGRLPTRGPLAAILAVCVLGLVLNALICGVLAAPYGRFQARVAWLVPLLLALAVLGAEPARSHRTEGVLS